MALIIITIGWTEDFLAKKLARAMPQAFESVHIQFASKNHQVAA